MLDRYLKDIKKYDPLTRDEEKDLFIKAKAGDMRAKDMLITCNLRFVVQVAREYQNQGLELEELIQEGNIGIIKAYEKFDYTRGNKFITYAVWWIRQSISGAIYEHARSIRLPLNKIANVHKVNKLKELTEQTQSRTVDVYELSDLLDDPGIIDDLQYNYTIIHLDKPQTENDGDLNDVITDDNVDVFRALEPVRDELKLILSEFNEREQKILSMYFGLDHIRRYTLKEIGYEMRLTRERIRQIKDKVIEKLQKKKRSDKLIGYVQ